MAGWVDSEQLREAVQKVGGQTVFAALVTKHTEYSFNQDQISKLCGRQRRINDANRLGALKTVIEKVLAGELTPPAISKSARYSERSEESNGAVRVEFWKAYPPSYESDFARATELSISGLDLRRLHGQIGALKKVIRRKGRVRIIFLDPEYYELCRYGTVQDWGKDTVSYAERYRDSIWTTYEMILSQVRTGRAHRVTKQKDRSTGTLEIRALRYPMGFGIDSMTFDDPNGGVVYIRNYPMYGGVDDRPILALTPAHDYWYSFYKEQFEIHWQKATPWTTDKRRTWKDFRPDQARSK